MIHRILVLFLLCLASLPVLAGDTRAVAEDCPSPLGADEGDAVQGGPHGDGESAAGEKAPSASPRGEAGSGMRGPRMHNLLPGMFR